MDMAIMHENPEPRLLSLPRLEALLFLFFLWFPSAEFQHEAKKKKKGEEVNAP
jgi:hypothetical protein